MNPETVKSGIDFAAGATILGTIVEVLPAFAAACAIAWFGIRIYEYIRWVRRGRKNGHGPGTPS